MERYIALKILLGVFENGKYSNLEINKSLSDLKNEEEKALITALVYGVIQNRIRIDHIIKTYAGRKKLDTDILNILRIGVYQIVFTDKIPDYAIVNESLKLVQKCRKNSAKGFVNAVLRSIIREDKKVEYDKDDFLSIYYSCPKELCRMLIHDFGESGENMIKHINDKPPFTARINTLKISETEFEKISGEHTENGVVYFAKGRNVGKDELYLKGYYYPQDINSMLPPIWLNPKPGDTVIDMCAAPGGKTTHIAQLMRNSGTIYAFDIYEHKIKLIEKTSERLGVNIVKPIVADACEYNPEFAGKADKVLADVPCSGFGIMRRKPEIKYTHTVEDSKALSEIQYKILENSAKYLKHGGTLIYSTCTVSKAENEDNIKRFLNEHKEFRLERQKQLFIGENGGDGFYIAEMTKNEE